MRILALVSIVALAAGCGTGDTEYGRTGDHVSFTAAALSLKSSSGLDVLRVGQAMTLQSLTTSDALLANTKYRVVVASSDSTIFEGDLLTDSRGTFSTSTLAHDVGEFEDGLGDGKALDVTLDDGVTSLKGQIAISARRLLGAGWQIDEMDTPHVYAATSAGVAHNAFVVGGQDPGEVSGTVYVAGDHFPANVTMDVYVLRDRDEWKGYVFPAAGDPNLLAGPIEVTTDAEGNLAATSTGYAPQGAQDLGPFDIVVDVDRNGQFDWTMVAKDAADGENKVGFTVQYSQAWLRAQASKHIIVNLAYNSSSRQNGAYENTYSTKTVHGYVNPPVFNDRSDYHRRGLYVLVEHKSWEQFWNNPDPSLDAGCEGCRDLKPFLANVGGGGGDFAVPLQPGCMNGPPVAILDPAANGTNGAGVEIQSYDLVFLADHKDKTSLIYRPGKDLLDLNMVSTNTQPLDPTQITDDQAQGFRVQ